MESLGIQCLANLLTQHSVAIISNGDCITISLQYYEASIDIRLYNGLYIFSTL